ncbi:MAG: FAD-binding oxidoreductase [Candidatus Poribacteria bacterium]|nr:FAD-binding oxidoreductase [Candidatus Poribacteria bacterium]
MNWEPMTLNGWGRAAYASVIACAPEGADEVIEAIRAADNRGIIAFGGGRSYGDVALNSGGRTVLTALLNRVESFEADSGTLVCGPGLAFHDLLAEFLPRGYVVPVSPGTGFTTIGGAVANDVHGKNHDRSGSFGDHVRWIDLLLPSGEVVRISPESRPDLFAATIGGIGLTGIMLRVCFNMQRVPSNAVELREERMPDLDAFFATFERVRATATFSVGWIDALARGASLGRGILGTAELTPTGMPDRRAKRLRVPLDFQAFAINPRVVSEFNGWYYHRVPTGARERLVPLERFFYPLDAVLDWNRVYGRRGFYQFQCVLPDAASAVGIPRLLEEISCSRSASFLAVLKTLGSEGRGYLSFPIRGYTLALDFPRRPGTEELLARLERITLDNGGRIYLAKDSRLSPLAFEAMYPKLEAFRAVLDEIDPQARMRSDLARRLRIRQGRTNRIS